MKARPGRTHHVAHCGSFPFSLRCCCGMCSHLLHVQSALPSYPCVGPRASSQAAVPAPSPSLLPIPLCVWHGAPCPSVRRCACTLGPGLLPVKTEVAAITCNRLLLCPADCDPAQTARARHIQAACAMRAGARLPTAASTIPSCTAFSMVEAMCLLLFSCLPGGCRIMDGSKIDEQARPTQRHARSPAPLAAVPVPDPAAGSSAAVSDCCEVPFMIHEG